MSIHERAADGAGDVTHGIRGRTRAGARRPGHARVLRVALEQVAQRGDLHELPAASSAVVDGARTAVEHRHGRMAVRAGQRAVARDGLETQIASAAGAMDRLARVHVEAGGAPDRRQRSVAMKAASRARRDPGTAGGAHERDGIGHGTRV